MDESEGRQDIVARLRHLGDGRSGEQSAHQEGQGKTHYGQPTDLRHHKNFPLLRGSRLKGLHRGVRAGRESEPAFRIFTLRYDRSPEPDGSFPAPLQAAVAHCRLPYAFASCRGRSQAAVRRWELPWKIASCRAPLGAAVGDRKLPYAVGSCRGRSQAAVRRWQLPWEIARFRMPMAAAVGDRKVLYADGSRRGKLGAALGRWKLGIFHGSSPAHFPGQDEARG